MSTTWTISEEGIMRIPFSPVKLFDLGDLNTLVHLSPVPDDFNDAWT